MAHCRRRSAKPRDMRPAIFHARSSTRGSTPVKPRGGKSGSRGARFWLARTSIVRRSRPLATYCFVTAGRQSRLVRGVIRKLSSVSHGQTRVSHIQRGNSSRVSDPVEVPVLQLRSLNVLGENEPYTRRRNVNDCPAEHV